MSRGWQMSPGNSWVSETFELISKSKAFVMSHKALFFVFLSISHSKIVLLSLSLGFKKKRVVVLQWVANLTIHYPRVCMQVTIIGNLKPDVGTSRKKWLIWKFCYGINQGTMAFATKTNPTFFPTWLQLVNKSSTNFRVSEGIGRRKMFEIYQYNMSSNGNKLPDYHSKPANSSFFVVSSCPDLIGCNKKKKKKITGQYSVQLNTCRFCCHDLEEQQ